MEDKLIMKDATKRSILRWIHIVFSIPILGYIYSPFEEIPKYAARVRLVVVPVMLLSGFWRNHNYPWFQRDKNWNNLRSDPGYQRILADIKSHWERYNKQFGGGG